MKGALGGVYDADGDGDFDVEDAKVLLGEWDLLVYVAFFRHDWLRWQPIQKCQLFLSLCFFISPLFMFRLKISGLNKFFL